MLYTVFSFFFPSVQMLLRGENDLKQSDEFQASIVIFLKQKGTDFGHFYYHTNFWVFLSFCFFFGLLFTFVVWVWLLSFFQSFAFTSFRDCTLLQHQETAKFLKKISFSPFIQTQSKKFCGPSQSCLPQMHHLACLPCNWIHNATNLIFLEKPTPLSNSNFIWNTLTH